MATPEREFHASRTHDPDAPVVVRFPALGDAVLLTPLIEALARRYGRPIHLLASGDWTPVLLNHDPDVAELRMVTSRRAPYWSMPSQWSAVRWLRAHRGPIYFCERDVYGERLLARTGLPEAQVLDAWAHYPGDQIHWADWWLAIAALDPPGLPGPPMPAGVPARPRIHADPAWARDADAWLAARGVNGRPLVLMQPGHKKTYKRGRIGTLAHDKHWPAERWAAVAAAVCEQLPDAAVLVCGSTREAGLVQEIIDATLALRPGARLVNVARDPSLGRLAAFAARAHSMISVDTGPAHLAGAMDCPLVVLYASAGWGRWLPRTASAQVIALGLRQPDPARKLLDLSAHDVIDAWRGLQPRAATVPAPAEPALR
ncbi:MAG: glycosyltransferase family 9 protein [Burkholderiaceae bacterium]